MKVLAILYLFLMSTGVLFASQKSFADMNAELYEVRLTLLEEALIQGDIQASQNLIMNLIVKPAHRWWFGYVNYNGNNILTTAIVYNRDHETLLLCKTIKSYFGPEELHHFLHRKDRRGFMPLELAAIKASDKTCAVLIDHYGWFFSTKELLRGLEYLFCGYLFKHGFAQGEGIVALDEKLRADDLVRRAVCKDCLCWHLARREDGRMLVQEVISRWYNYFMRTGIPLPDGMFLDWKL